MCAKPGSPSRLGTGGDLHKEIGFRRAEPLERARQMTRAGVLRQRAPAGGEIEKRRQVEAFGAMDEAVSRIRDGDHHRDEAVASRQGLGLDVQRTDDPPADRAESDHPDAHRPHSERSLRPASGAGVCESGSYPLRVRLAVGTVVAYPPHGVGRVTARQKRVVLGAEQDVVVIELAEGLSVSLPLERARAQLRPLANEADLHRVEQTLRENGPLSEDVWATRLKEMQEKLRGGDLLELAQIVRDGVRREQSAKGTSSRLSTSERALCSKARELLSGEIGLVRGLDQASANAWIDDQLTPSAAA